MENPVLWKNRPALPIPAAGGHSGFLNDQILYLGGTTWRKGYREWLSDAQVYQEADNSWRVGVPMPCPLAYAASVWCGTSVELYGGCDSEGPCLDCWRLDCGTQEFQRTGQIPAARLFARAEIVEEFVYLLGGCVDSVTAEGARDILLRRESGTWRKIATLPQGGLSLAASACVRHFLFIFGGCSASNGGKVRDLDDAWRFDTRSAEWQRLRPLPRKKRGLSAIALDGRYILLMGGHTASLGAFEAELDVYDMEADNYRRLGSLLSGAMCVELLSTGSEIFAVGGEDRVRGRTGQFLSASVEDLIGRVSMG